MATLFYQSFNNQISLTVNFMEDYSFFHAEVVLEEDNQRVTYQRSGEHQIRKLLKKGIYWQLSDGSEILMRIHRFFFVDKFRVWINKDQINGYRISK